MKESVPKYVNQNRASALLGIPVKQLCQLSCEAGFGHREFVQDHEEVFFTYEELRQICQLATKVH